MKLQEKWKQFEKTGCVSDYLEYRTAFRNQTSGYSFGEKTLSHMDNRTGEQYGNRTGRSDGDGADRITGERVR